MSQTVSILGAGESGIGAALLAKQQGMHVFVSDMGTISPARKRELEEAGISFESGKHSEDQILNTDVIIKSPGIPDTHPLVKKAKAAGKTPISEIEFAGKYTDAKTILITGTNGKTTTTTLVHHVLSQNGINAGIAGNIGTSLARSIAEGPKRDVYVIEVSSFQLDGMFDFSADISILLNITPDHLDRYDYELANYVDSKFRVIQNQQKDAHFIYNADDPIIEKKLEPLDLPMNKWPVSTSKTLSELGHLGGGIENNQLHINTQTEPFTMKIQELALQGKHNLFNSMAAGVTAKLFELRKEGVRDSLTNFENLEHRLEFVAKVHGITFINDSKATNTNSAWYALESMDKPVIWIAGGVDKGNEYDDLLPLVNEKVKAIICLGKDNKKITKAFDGVVAEIVEVTSAEDAVRMAYDLAFKGDAVLLSPACASFDLFDNYEDRGHQFKKAVKGL
ncbi:MAG: UDP-N-acetylmuramoyl-L-alanine--D-glutamate ligase [Flavobacteriales bacterium]|nr:UDP-N-acetylmuramoyl-L-alanine--D-glutamate ligase [Flavobacteriales bacterium]MDG2246361.1 UDP-N-acetylmuramoyl-L-alanine--D-glutamate ligase [Flavobacteriales bacterium]